MAGARRYRHFRSHAEIFPITVSYTGLFMGSLDLENFWRSKLEEAQRQYNGNPTSEARAKYEKLFRVVADILARGLSPSGCRGGTTWPAAAGSVREE